MACGSAKHSKQLSRRLMRDAAREKHTEFHDTCQDSKDTDMSTKEFDMVRSNIFNFQSIQSIIIAKLKAKASQRTELCKCKMDKGSDGNLMPTRMFKMLYPNTKIMNLNKLIDKKSIVHIKNLCLHQMGVYKVTITDTGIEYQFSFW